MPKNETSPETALITGATHGIGLALAQKLLNKGMTVIGIGRDQNSLDALKKQFPNFVPICADLTQNRDIETILTTVKNLKRPLHLLVQNAGMKTPPRNLEEHSCQAIDEVIAVNLSAPMKLTALLTPYMPPHSRILYVTSRAATLKLKQSSTYCATKAGLDEVAAIVRQECQHKKIAVASVIPGEVDTKIQEILRDTSGFHLHGMFRAAHQAGKLIKPKVCADFLAWLLCNLELEQYNAGNIFNIYDTSHHKHWLNDDLPSFPFGSNTQNTTIRASL